MAEKEIDVYGIDEANNESQKEYQKRRARDIDDLQKILRLPEGRRFLLKILTESGMFHASFSLNSMTTAFNEGKRDIGLWLLKDIDEAEPRAYPQMVSEYYSEKKSKKAKQEDDNAR